jgi:antitoxin component of MazEF toxin-antitoxin module
MGKAYKSVVKEKHLQNLGNTKAIILPNSWLRELDWVNASNLVLEYHPFKKEIVICEGKAIDEVVKTGEPVVDRILDDNGVIVDTQAIDDEVFNAAEPEVDDEENNQLISI